MAADALVILPSESPIHNVILDGALMVPAEDNKGTSTLIVLEEVQPANVTITVMVD